MIKTNWKTSIFNTCMFVGGLVVWFWLLEKIFGDISLFWSYMSLIIFALIFGLLITWLNKIIFKEVKND